MSGSTAQARAPALAALAYPSPGKPVRSRVNTTANVTVLCTDLVGSTELAAALSPEEGDPNPAWASPTTGVRRVRSQYVLALARARRRVEGVDLDSFAVDEAAVVIGREGKLALGRWRVLVSV